MSGLLIYNLIGVVIAAVLLVMEFRSPKAKYMPPFQWSLVLILVVLTIPLWPGMMLIAVIHWAGKACHKFANRKKD